MKLLKIGTSFFMQNHFYSVIFHIMLVYWCLNDSKFRTKFQVIRGDFKHYSRSTWTIYLIDVKNISVCVCLEFRMWNIGYFKFSTINVKLQCGVNKKNVGLLPGFYRCVCIC